MKDDSFTPLDLRAAGAFLGLTYETMRSYSKVKTRVVLTGKVKATLETPNTASGIEKAVRAEVYRRWTSRAGVKDTEGAEALAVTVRTDSVVVKDIVGRELTRGYIESSSMLPPPDGSFGRSRWWYAKTLREWDSNRPGSPWPNAPTRQKDGTSEDA